METDFRVLFATTPGHGSKKLFHGLEGKRIKTAAVAGITRQRVQRAVGWAIVIEQNVAVAAFLVLDFFIGLADRLEAFWIGLGRRLFEGFQVSLADGLVIRLGWHAKNKVWIHGLKQFRLV